MKAFDENLLVDLLKTELNPAVGCTEPVAVALNSAAARENLGENFKFTKNTRIKVEVSKSIYRNGLDVGIPNSNIEGLDMAASLGLAIGNTREGLSLLANISPEQKKKCKFIYENIKPEIIISESDSSIYIRTSIIKGNRVSSAITKYKHDNILSKSLDKNNNLPEDKLKEKEKRDLSKVYNFKILEIIEGIERLDYKELNFLREGIDMNIKAAKLGIEKRYGLGVGYSYYQNIKKGKIPKNLLNLAYAYTTAASDVRMSGELIEIMSLGGSGNNGLTASIPIYIYASVYKISDEDYLKALAISYILTLYAKNYIGRLSNICSCSLAASIGLTSSITWLMSCKENIPGAINNILGNLSGVICDGAKGGCSLKLGAAVTSSIQSAFLVKEGSFINHNSGIVNKDAEQSLRNISILNEQAMKDIADITINIMRSR